MIYLLGSLYFLISSNKRLLAQLSIVFFLFFSLSESANSVELLLIAGALSYSGLFLSGGQE